MLSPGYHPNLDVERLPVSAEVNNGVGLPFVIFCLLLANGGILGLGVICFWPPSQYLPMCILASISVLLLCVAGYGRVHLVITERYVDWMASRIPFVTTRWREPLSAYTQIAVREVRPSVSLVSFRPGELTRYTLSDEGRKSGRDVKLVEILLHHGARPDEKSVALGCFLLQDKRWQAFAELAGKTFNLGLLKLER
ncbi:MAG TPA: hypothetical protein PLU72_15295 [Candidatus Ozemobacteraceae bacterium]|nr:hypothetical protein [Candidatus Ozemobacteraceae bacterium]